MTAHAKAPTTDEINEMLCARNDQLEAEKAALAEMRTESLTVTSRYAHMFDSRLDDVAGRLPEIRDQNATTGEAAEGLDHVRH